ncbi:hypothetical protein BDF20DRAFT_821858 [Mycotypha africana]|uniref:uncharacterized protein n=1 Tax=Mycotypha africana TaxID=64632 RepID=UPI0023002B19|nr:uncharacterized protein BDF20DRAFT_821858 [Mycotypha africana]KAI8975758.1 hypothetical protein BDF20DRAFT_821858 [Mycotypha africana]
MKPKKKSTLCFLNLITLTNICCSNSLQDLIEAPANSNDILNCVIHTDGFAVTFLFVRAKKKNSDIPLLTLEEFTRDEIERYFVPFTVDAGRSQIFTAAVGYDSVHHQVRSYSKEERANIAGYIRRAKIVDNKKNITGLNDIESEMPTSKTVHSDGQYLLYLSYVLQHLQALHDFYGFIILIITKAA